MKFKELRNKNFNEDEFIGDITQYLISYLNRDILNKYIPFIKKNWKRYPKFFSSYNTKVYRVLYWFDYDKYFLKKYIIESIITNKIVPAKDEEYYTFPLTYKYENEIESWSKSFKVVENFYKNNSRDPLTSSTITQYPLFAIFLEDKVNKNDICFNSKLLHKLGRRAKKLYPEFDYENQKEILRVYDKKTIECTAKIHRIHYWKIVWHFKYKKENIDKFIEEFNEYNSKNKIQRKTPNRRA